ncbi:two-partner secretion domain-containing protein [Pseudomonas reactans]|uniref:two-partner secretion domain-containing protein n=1 Tax=Pseudomonas reactans TaxID=117680 RepID=UPI00159F7ACB|nr:filamentous hemagglutinin N-terminal domain-containing protein [Pseudomonas reactans]NWC87108.1 filamentous hemagglutinin N-terminal domain-containing protein [Pseudomonas reactans]
MDVRQFAFLARQPSAAVKSRSTFLGLPKRGLALVLANAMFWQPLLAQADGIAVSGPGTTLGQAGNGVPIVNIAAPNANGLSHNQFHDYNVGANGVILNNATDRTQSTQLGGIIVGNPNFHGSAASVILNEVNGGSPSQLSGYTEVAGQSAHVIVANPYGISCNGCGFINTPQATLTTGKAVIENGQISRYQVDKGNVSIEGTGLNASNVDQFEIITRATIINAQIQAKKLTIVAGRNDVDARTLNATVRAADGSKAPDLAIDSSALGGMYVGAVKLVGTEAGVGVKLSGDMVAGGDIRIDAAGNVVLGQTSAGTAVVVKAASVEAKGAVYAGTDLSVNTQGALINQQTLAAKDSITLDAAGRLTNNGIIEAGVNADNSRNAQGDVRLKAQSIDNTGKTVIASRDLSINTGELANQGGTLSAQRDAQLNASILDNQNQGRILSAGSLGVTASQLLNQNGQLLATEATLAVGSLGNDDGQIQGDNALSIKGSAISNLRGTIAAGKRLDVTSAVFDNTAGKVISDGLLTTVIASQLLNQTGLFASKGDARLTLGSLDNRQGTVVANTNLNLQLNGVLNNQHGTLHGDNRLDLNAGHVDNSVGGRISSGQTLNASVSSLDQHNDGRLFGQGDVSLDLNGGHLNNQGGLIHAPGVLLLNNLASVDNRGGEISSAQALVFKADSLDNRNGKLLSEQGLQVRIAQTLDNAKGLVASTGLDLQANSLNNTDGKLSARNDLTARVTTSLLNGQGEILGATTLLTGTSLDNGNGLIQGDQRLTLNHTGLISNRNGRVIAGLASDLNAASLDNTGGTFTSDGTLKALINGQLLNQAGLFASTGLLQLTAASLDNQNNGRITGKSELALTVGQLDNRSGLLNAGKTMTLKVDSLDNRAGEMSSLTDLALNGSQLDNSAGGKVLANGDIQLNLDRLNNQFKGNVFAKRNLNIVLNGPLLNQQGTLRSDATLTLDMNHGALNNAAGLINTPGALILKNLSTVANQQGEISSEHAFSLAAQSLDNSEGKLLSDQALTLKIDQALVNIKGVIAAAGLNAQAARLDNTEGVLNSSKDLTLAVAGAWLNTEGEVSSAGASVIDAMTLNNRNGQVLGDVSLALTTRGALANQGGTLGAGQRLQVTASSVDNSQSGSLVSDGSVTVQVGGLLDNQAKGRVLSKGNMTLQAGSFDNRGGVLNSKQAQTLTGQSLKNQGGLVSAVGPLRLTLDTADNTKGRIASQADLDATVGVLNQQGGELAAQGNLSLSGNDLDNRNGGLVGATKVLKLNVDRVDNRVGEISGQLKTEISGQRLDNSGGKVLAGTALELAMVEVINRAKGLVFAQDVHLNAASLDNTEGTLAGQRSLAVRLSAGLDNMRGKISSEGGLQLHAQRVDNSGGSLSSAGDLTLASDGELLNVGGVVESAQALSLTSAGLNNSAQGLLKSQGAATLTTGQFNNGLGGRAISANSLDIKATDLNNGGRIASTGALNANLASLTQASGSELFSSSQVNLGMNHGELANAGVINAPILVLKNLGNVNNRNGEISSQNAFTLAARSLDNGNGKLISNQALDLRIEQALANAKGSISAVGLNVHSASLDNTDGLVSSRGGLEIGADGLVDNQRGSLIGDGAVLLTAAKLDNRAGEIAGKAKVTVNANRIDNQKGQLVSTDTLALTGANLDNRNGLVGATKALKLDVGDVDNRTGELTSNADLSITGQRLDNSDGGQVFAAAGLSVAVDNVLNRVRGQLNGQRLTLTGTALDNSGGKLLSQQLLVVDLAGDLTNNQGLLSSEGTLDVKARSLDNTKGSLSSAQGLNVVVSDNLNNQGGELVTDASLTLRSANLGNQQGTLSSKGPVAVTTGTLNNQAGRLNSGDTLTLVAGQVNNGGSIGSAKALDATVTGLEQQAGKLFSQAGLSLDLSNGQLDNRGGLINASGPLLLKNLATVDNQGGEISSDQAFTLAAQSLDNSNGKLLSNQALTLRINQALANIKGLVGAANLNLHAGSVGNQGGTLTGRGELQLTSDGLLNNQGGNLLGGSRVILNAMALDNTVIGLVNSQGSLDIATGNLSTGSGGEVSAKGSMDLKLSGLTLGGGQIVGAQGVTLDLNGAELDNRNGLISAKGTLALNRVRAINNQNGELSTQQNLTLNLNSLDNSGGKLISSQLLSVNAGTLLNQNGLLSGWQGLSVSGDSLDNRNNGTLSSRNGAVDVRLTGALLNTSAGAVASQGRLDLTAASLDNSGGILSSGAGQSLTVTGQLNNRNAGLIGSGAELELQAVTLDNQGGTVSAQKALAITATDLNNTGGTVAGNDRLTLNLLGSLNNTNGKLASAGPLSLKRAMQINNQGGQIASQGLLTLLAGGLDNSQLGTVAGKGRVAITTTGILQNDAKGLIYSQEADLQIKSAGLSNVSGVVQGQSGLSFDVSGDIDNQGGKLLAQTGDTVIRANTLNNQGGNVASLAGGVDAALSDSLLNGVGQSKGGVVQGQRVNLTALTVDNQQGRIAAQDGDAVITANQFLNAYGGVYAKGTLQTHGTWLDNSFGQISAKRIDLGVSGQLSNHSGIIESEETLTLQANDLVNQGGQLRALARAGKTQFQIGNLFDNRNGVVETANTNLGLAATTFQNTGGQLLHTGEGDFDISLPNVTGAGGSIVTRGGLTLNADTWTNSSVIEAGRLNVNVGTFTQTETGQLLASSRLEGKGGHWINNGLIASDGGLALQLTGGYEGSGRVSSVGALDLTAAQLTVGQLASIAGGGNSHIAVGGTLANEGRITSARDLNVSAGAINNSGTLGSNANLRLTTPALLNQNGLIFSGGDMALRTDTFTNRFADVYGLGNVSIAKDDNNGQSTSINNISATIESGGDLNLAAASIENRKDVFKTTGGLVSSYIGLQCSSCSYIDTNRSTDSYLVWAQNFKSQIEEDSAAASMTAGRNFTVTGGDLSNKNSTLTAGGTINFVLQNFISEGTSVGEYSLRRSYSFGDVHPYDLSRFMQTVMNYNRGHDPSYNPRAPNIHVWTSNGTESVVRVINRRNGREDPGNTQYGPLNVKASLYVDPSIGATDGPWEMVSTRPFNSTTIGSTTAAGAVVQAGGAVSINATQNLTNSVVRQNVAVTGNASRVGATQVTGNTAVMVTINRVLPPGLALQQVNPVALPGFTLPTGKNGLFRLNGQAANTGQVSSGDTGAQSWTLGDANVGLVQRQQPSPDVSGRILQVSNAAQAAAGVHQVALTARDAGAVSGSASTISVAGNTDSGALPTGRTTGIEISHGNAANTQVSRPDLGLPVLTPAARDTNGALDGSIASNTGAAINIPILTPLAQGSTQPGAAQPINRVQGLPNSSALSQPHKYLIETNPALTDLKQFMSSDYLLAGLGYNPDESAKRLGDGLYEQRLIQQAVVAHTGQRFLDGQTSDDALFRYLMDNAIRSKQRLDLSVGVSLTDAQVAALTHDIVWLEEHEVAGEKVLVPVLYLANADQRLTSNGALIAGQDVSLIAGKDLVNAGTLRASNNLSAAAGDDLVNSGRIEAGNRLDLLAGNNIVNQSGGVIAGRDVALTAVKGDVVNERSLTGLGMGEGNRNYYGDSARIEAANDLTIKAARDFTNSGSFLKSGGDTLIDAGRDINIVATKALDSGFSGMGMRTSAVTQSTSSVSAGRDVVMNGGRDLNAIASSINAKRDIVMNAKESMTIASAANEEHAFGKSKKRTIQEDHVSQVGSLVSAGADVRLSAGHDMDLISSRITAGDEAYLVAGEKLSLLAAQDSDYSLYDMKKKSKSKKQTQHDEVTKVVNVGSEVKAGGDIALISGGDQKYQAAKLESDQDLTVQSGGGIEFEGVKDLHQESHSKSKSSLSWNSMSGKGNTDETFKQTQMTAKGNIVIKAVDGLKIDVKHVNQETVSQAIDAMVKADPQLAWLKEAEKRGDVDWHKVQEIHESFKYSNSSLGSGAALVIAIIVTYFTWGLGAELVGAAATSTTGLAASAVYTGVAVKTATSTINNRGDLGAIAKDVTSGDSLKSYAIAGLSGPIAKLFGVTGAFTAADLGRQLAVNSALKTVVNGGSFTKNVGQAALDLSASLLSGMIYEQVGTKLVGSELSTKVAVHAIVGGLIAEAAGGDFVSGAVAAGANKALIQAFGDDLFPGEAHERLLAMTSQLIGMTVAAGLGGSAKDQEVAAWVAQQGTIYNELQHKEVEALIGEARTCEAKNNCREVINKYADLNEANEKRLNGICENDPAKCREAYSEWVVSYYKTHEFISQVRASGSLPDEVSRMLIAVDVMNTNSRDRVLAAGIAQNVFGAASQAAAGVGVDVAPETLGTLSKWTAILFGAKKAAGSPTVTIRDHYDHHLNMVDDIKDQLIRQGYRVSDKEISFGSSCGTGRCRPDIVAEAPDGTIRIIEVKTGNADLSIRQSEIFPQIRDGSSIPRGQVAERFGLIPGKALKDQGYPNGIPIEVMIFPGAKK